MLSLILDIFAVFCLIGGIVVLIVLSVIDLRIGLLPNVYNGMLAVFGGGFHALVGFYYLSPVEMISGVAMGAGLLYAVRFFANRYYEQDSLGLGDVKLLAAAGVWLGPDGVLLALIAGAMAGIVHGGVAFLIGRTKGEAGSLSRYSLPAGPGFAVGIFAAGVYQLHPFVTGLFS